MNIAKISTKGQVTLPIDVRRKLNLKEGDHLLISEENGRYYIDNADHVQNILSERAFAYTTEDVKFALHLKKTSIWVCFFRPYLSRFQMFSGHTFSFSNKKNDHIIRFPH